MSVTMTRQTTRTYTGIEPLKPEPDLEPPRPGSPWVRRILGLIVLAAAVFGAARLYPVLWPGREVPEETVVEPTPEPIPEETAAVDEVVTPTPLPTLEVPEIPDEPRQPVSGTPTPAPVQVAQVPQARPTPPRMPQSRPESRPAPRPTPPPASPQPPVRRPESSARPPATPPRATVPSPTPTPVPVVPRRQPIEREPEVTVGDQIEVKGEFIPQLPSSRARPLRQPRPIELPADALRSRLSGQRIAVTVQVSRYGRVAVKRIDYPSGTSEFLRRRAQEIVEQIRFEAARDGQGNTVQDEVTVDVPLR